MIRRNFPNKRVYEIEYKAKLAQGMRFNADSKSWITDRTRALAGLILDIKNNEMIFPAYSAIKENFAPDLLTLMCEYNDRIRAFQIIRDNNIPDDFAHTLVYLRLGARYFLSNPYQKEFQLDEFQPPNADPQSSAESEIHNGSYDVESDMA